MPLNMWIYASQFGAYIPSMFLLSNVSYHHYHLSMRLHIVTISMFIQGTSSCCPLKNECEFTTFVCRSHSFVFDFDLLINVKLLLSYR